MPTVQRVAIFSLVPILYATWLYQVNITLPEPYLDEVFHVPQAQAYCAGQFGRWDPKITTPPGLYLLSYLLHQAKHIIFGGTYCALANLRWLNSLVASFIIPAQVWDVYRQSEMGHDRSTSFHTVINIALFPLIFFFSGLYYTDVCSVSFVLGAYEYHLRSLRHAPASRKMDMLKIFATGLCALSMRQTNIFWVAIFLAGLHAIHQVKREGQPSSESTRSPWHEMEPRYDPPVSKAYLEHYIMTAVILAAKALRDPLSLLLSLWPYLALLASFSIFILINGGVVLGDKENHVASIHTPQMLYIWPYFMFFSWPIIVPHVIHILSSDLQYLKRRLPRPIIALPIILTMTLAVHFNTIIHPFTLADNRHYIFYVFRLLILKHPLLKYAAVPIYFICAWAVLATLGNAIPSSISADTSAKKPNRTISPPPPPTETAPKPILTSFLLIYLISTTLSLTTAPLVEPRYFILPWLIWRLHVQPPLSLPLPLPPSQTRTTRTHPKTIARLLDRILRAPPSAWLYLETGWFLLVNLVTCGVFLRCGFEWEQERGRVQRFMW